MMLCNTKLLASFSCEDNEGEGSCEVQGQVLKVPVHTGSVRYRESRQVETISTTRWVQVYVLGC